MKLSAVKSLVEDKKMHMEVIVNNKVGDNVHSVQTYFFTDWLWKTRLIDPKMAPKFE